MWPTENLLFDGLREKCTKGIEKNDGLGAIKCPEKKRSFLKTSMSFWNTGGMADIIEDMKDILRAGLLQYIAG